MDALVTMRTPQAIRALRTLYTLGWPPDVAHALLRLGDTELVRDSLRELRKGCASGTLLTVLDSKPSLIPTEDLQLIASLQDVKEEVRKVWDDSADHYTTEILRRAEDYTRYRELAQRELQRRASAARCGREGD